MMNDKYIEMRVKLSNLYDLHKHYYAKYIDTLCEDEETKNVIKDMYAQNPEYEFETFLMTLRGLSFKC